MWIVIIFILGIALALWVLVKGLEPHKPMTEYELFGEEGADGFEQRMMGLTDDEYEEFRSGTRE